MPSYKTKDVDENNKPIYRDICYPVTKEFREKLYGVILETHQVERQKRLQDASENNLTIKKPPITKGKVYPLGDQW